MEKLLQWSIANANGDQETIDRVGAPDPKALAELLGAGGPDEPTLMKQAMQVITHPEADLEAKEVAFDNFEMLIENLDNANNIENLNLWEPLLQQLVAPEEVLQRYACSVIGTAVQNNDKAQGDLLKHDGAFASLISIAGNEGKLRSHQVRLKALYALSNAIRHSQAAYDAFSGASGWDLVRTVANEAKSDDKVATRLNSLLTSIVSSGVTEDKKTNLQQIFPEDKYNEILQSYQ